MKRRVASYCVGTLSLFLGAAWGVQAQNDLPPLELSDLILMTVEKNPKLAKVQLQVREVRGKAIQAGLYPNPNVDYLGDELGDITAYRNQGIQTVMVSQEIVTAKKLQLSSGALYKEADQASLTVISERYKLFASVRQDFFDLLTLQRRAEILDAVVKLAEASVDTSEKLLKGKQVARLDVVQLEVDLERYKAELAATQRRIPATYRRLAANVGVQDLPYQPVKGSLDAPLPDYELDQVREYVLEIHPDVRRAQIGVEANQIWLRRAQVEPIPNLRLQTGYVRQFENRTPGSPTGSHDWLAHAGIAVPLFNRNQGNIQAAQALIGESIQQVEQTRNDLAAQVADAYANYAASRTQAQRYRDRIIPKANESYQLALKAYQGGQFEYLRVLEAQRAMANTRLEYITVLGTMWQQASLLSGLMLEDEWPPTAGAPAMPSRPNEPKDLLPNQLRDGTEILPAPNPGQ